MITSTCELLSMERVGEYVHRIKLKATQPLDFLPGQYLQVVMSDTDKRPFSLANNANSDGLVELHVGAHPGNSYAAEVLDEVLAKGKVTCEIGLGDANYQPFDGILILVAGGTGYSYAKSILHYALSFHPKQNISLYWGGKTRDDLYELNELSRLAETHSQFSLIPCVETELSGWEGEIGLVTDIMLAKEAPLTDKRVHVAGRFEMVKVLKQQALQHGLDASQLIGDAVPFV